MSNTIQRALPVTKHGANWGIQHVRAALARLRIRAPKRIVAKALQTISCTFKIQLSFVGLSILVEQI
jgi:hypothetical protein